MVDLGASFIDLKDRDRDGRTPLLLLACNDGDGYNPAKFEFLLRRGSSIHARDNEGRTCLHICIMHARCDNPLGEQESLVFLVQNGADVDACDNFGHSISDSAFLASDEGASYIKHYRTSFLVNGGYPGDLWDSVLVQCGYNIIEKRRGFPRRPQYTKYYSRKTFEELWRGHEELCPYYQDPPVWDPDDDLEEFDGSGEGYPENLAGGEDSEGLTLTGCVVESDGEKLGRMSNHDLPPTTDHSDTITDPRRSLSPLSKIPQALERDMLEPTLSAWQILASSQPGSDEEELCHVSVMPEPGTPCEDWPSPSQTILPAQSFHEDSGSRVFELLEPNPWL